MMEPDKIFITMYASPLGHLKISATASHITEILFSHEFNVNLLPGGTDISPVMRQCIMELEEYFNGDRRSFDVPFRQHGTAFQQRVWNELMQIPFGKTISYLELARRLGDVKSIRAAASTNGKNKLSVIVPCHRVIGSNSELVGYAGGLANKRWLLEHEGKIAHGVQTLF